METEKPAQLMYKKSSEVVPELIQKQEKWCENLLEEIDICQAVLNLKYISEVVKIQSFQYRILMHALVTNVQLERWGIKETNKCTFTCDVPETCYHLFFECPHVQPLLQMVRDMCPNSAEISMTYRNVILSQIHTNPRHVSNTIITVYKHYVYKKRCLGQLPCRIQLHAVINQTKGIEKYYASKTHKIGKFTKKWDPKMYADMDILKQIDCEHLLNC